jgi:hypothetical protein
MYLLAPTAATAGAASGGIIQRLLSDEFLRKWGAPGGNMFEKGFPLRGRLVNFAYKGVVFSVIGMLAGGRGREGGGRGRRAEGGGESGVDLEARLLARALEQRRRRRLS